MRNIAWTLLIAGAVCVSGASAQERTLAPARARVVFCDNQILNGHFAVSITGTRPAPLVLPAFPGVPPGTIEQVIGVFILIFDGNGSIRMGDNPTVKGSLSGLIPDRAGTGTYSVNADCSGTFSVTLPQLPAPLVNNFVVLGSGQELRGVVISPQPVMISVTGSKLQ